MMQPMKPRILGLVVGLACLGGGPAVVLPASGASTPVERFAVPALSESIQMRIPVRGTVARPPRVTLMEEGGAGARGECPVVVAVGTDGGADRSRVEALVTIAPTPGLAGTRRFRLVASETPDGAGFGVGPGGWPDGRVPADIRDSRRQSTAEADRRAFWFDDAGKGMVELSLGGQRPIFTYNHGTVLKPGVPADRARSSYLHPLRGLDGEALTDDFPVDHYHHRGVFWSWPHVGVGGREYDLWMLKGIGHRFERFLGCVEAGADGAVLGVENGWYAGEKRVMRERIWMTTFPEAGDGRAIDLDCTWIPEDREVSLTGAEGKSYGGMTIRYAPGRDTVITTPLGNGTNDLYMTSLPWADLSRRWAEGGKVSGAALMVSPDHPDYPPTWLTRHYGVLCLGWPGVRARTFAPGVPIRCRYRIWVHRGVPGRERLSAVYDAYVRGWKVATAESGSPVP